MSYVEIEVRAKSVDLAVEAAMQELGVEDREHVAVEVLVEPEKGFLGFGGQDAVVRVKHRKPKKRRSDRRRKAQNRSRSSSKQQDRSQSGNNGRNRNQGRSQGKGRDVSRQQGDQPKTDDRPIVGLDEQARIAREFLEGLVAAYGLEGTVETSIDDDVIVANVNGEQTEALVGVRGSVRSSIHELTRTVLQRYSQDTARLRLDIAGYAERRRQALTIYADQLIDQLTSDGGEIMLEPMNAADRKVIHDAAAARDGVTSYSEGEAPRRFVVLAAEAGSSEDAGNAEDVGQAEDAEDAGQAESAGEEE